MAQWQAQCNQKAPAACQLLTPLVFEFVYSCASLHFTESAKVKLVHGLLRRAHLNGSPYHCASCLFLVQTALLAKPLLPHHGHLPFGNTLTVKSLPLLVCPKSITRTLTGKFFFSLNGLENGIWHFLLLPSLQVSNRVCCCEAIVILTQIINQIPHLGFLRLAYL